MKFYPIASGSSGNCILIASDAHSVLVDAGISGKKIEEGLRGIDMQTSDIDGILVTHEHSDHIKGIGVLARRYGIPVYTTGGTAEALYNMTQIGKIPEGLVHIIEADKNFQIGDLEIRAFRTSHDAAEPVGFRVEHDGRSAAVSTDLGEYTDYTIENLQNLDVLLLESNHDLRMLQAGRYPYYLKRRIMGEKGHLSNDDAGRLLCRLLHDRIKHVYLGHLSHENNYEALAFETVSQEVTMGDCPYKAADFDITIAHRDVVSEAVEF